MNYQVQLLNKKQKQKAGARGASRGAFAIRDRWSSCRGAHRSGAHRAHKTTFHRGTAFASSELLDEERHERTTPHTTQRRPPPQANKTNQNETED